MKKIILFIFLLFWFSLNTFADTVSENTWRNYFYSYFNYTDSQTYYVSVKASVCYITDYIWNDITSISPCYFKDNIESTWRDILWENSNFSLIAWYWDITDRRSVLFVDKIDNTLQFKRHTGANDTWYIYNDTRDIWINKDYIIYGDIYNYWTFIQLDLNTFILSIIDEITLSSTLNLFKAPLTKYVLSNDNQNYFFNNFIDDRLDYYNFDYDNLRTDNINFLQFSWTNTDNLWNFRQQSLNNNYVNHNWRLTQILNLNLYDLWFNILLGFKLEKMLVIPYSWTDNFPTYTINGYLWNFLAWISYNWSEYIWSYIINNIIYRITDNSVLTYEYLVNDTIDTGTGGLDWWNTIIIYDDSLFICDTDWDWDCEILNWELFLAIINFFKYIWDSIISSLWSWLDFFKSIDNIYTDEVKTFWFNILWIEKVNATNVASVFNNLNHTEYEDSALWKLKIFFSAFIQFILIILSMVFFILINKKS